MTQAPGERPPGQGFEAIQSPQAGQAAPSSSSAQSHIRLPGSGEAIPAENLTFVNKSKPKSSDEAVAQKINDSLRGSDDGYGTVQHVLKEEIPAVAATFHTLQEKPVGLGERVFQPGQADDRVTNLTQIVSEQVVGNISQDATGEISSYDDLFSLPSSVQGSVVVSEGEESLGSPSEFLAGLAKSLGKTPPEDVLEEDSSIHLTPVSREEAVKLTFAIQNNFDLFSVYVANEFGGVTQLEKTEENVKKAHFLLQTEGLQDRQLPVPIINQAMSRNHFSAMNQFIAGIYHERGIAIPSTGIPVVVLSSADWSVLISKITMTLLAAQNKKNSTESIIEKRSEIAVQDMITAFGKKGPKAKERNREDEERTVVKEYVYKSEIKHQLEKAEIEKFEKEGIERKEALKKEQHQQRVESKERIFENRESEIRRKTNR